MLLRRHAVRQKSPLGEHEEEMRMKLAVIGSNMVDLTAYIHHMPAPGETLEAPDFSISCGGKGANQAVAAALCGAGR